MFLIKTNQGYVAQAQGKTGQVVYTPERASAKHYRTEHGARHAAHKMRVIDPREIVSANK